MHRPASYRVPCQEDGGPHALGSATGDARPIAVSTPEATAVYLIEYSHSIGGVARAAEVIAGLAHVLTVAGLRQALASDARHPAHQRLGYVLQTLGLKKSLTTEVARNLPKLRRPVPLQPQLPYTAEGAVEPWRVIDNLGLSERAA